MPHSTFVGVEDGPIIALALLRLKRAKLTLPCSTRVQAINILRGVQPAPPRQKRSKNYFKYFTRATSPLENLNETT
jgi:hypothetical protein